MTPGSGGVGTVGLLSSCFYPASHPTTAGFGAPGGEVPEVITMTPVLIAGVPAAPDFSHVLRGSIFDYPQDKRLAGGGGGGVGGGPLAACPVPPCTAAVCDPNLPHAPALHFLNNGCGSGGSPAHTPAVDLLPEAVTTTPGQVLPPPPRARERDPAGGGSAGTTAAQVSPSTFTVCVPPTSPTHHRGPDLMVAVTTTPEIGVPSPKPHPALPRKTPVLMVAVTTTPETGHLPQPQPLLPRAASSSLQPISRGGEPRLPPSPVRIGRRSHFFPGLRAGGNAVQFSPGPSFSGYFATWEGTPEGLQ